MASRLNHILLMDIVNTPHSSPVGDHETPHLMVDVPPVMEWNPTATPPTANHTAMN